MTTTPVASSATDKTEQVAGAAAQAGADVAGTARQQAGQVASEAVGQAQQLLQQTTSQLNTQAAEQTQRAAGSIRRLSDHFSTMAEAGESGSPAHSLVRTAAERSRSVADYLDGKQPGDLVGDMQDFGRRRPGAFLLGAAAAGFAIGRMAMGAKRATGAGGGMPSGGGTIDLTGTPMSPGAPTVEVDPYPGTATGGLQ